MVLKKTLDQHLKFVGYIVAREEERNSTAVERKLAKRQQLPKTLALDSRAAPHQWAPITLICNFKF
jgi:hypothetical protein